MRNSSRGKKAGILLFVAVSIVGTVATGSAAFASIGECEEGRTCLWDNADYDNYIGSRPPGGDISNVSPGAADRTSSWANRSGTNAAWYKDQFGDGQCFNMPAHQRNPELGFFDRDTLSSWRTNHGC